LEHFHLTEEDDCYFLWEWDAKPYAQSAATDFIGNFQKDPKYRNDYWPWLFKQTAVRHAATAIGSTMLPEWQSALFVPVPPSKIKGDERHDCRLIDTLSLVRPAVAFQELVVQLANTQSRQKMIQPMTRAHNWRLGTLNKVPTRFVVFDDLLTGASHFAAMKIVLSRRFHGVPVSGLFLARRILPTSTSDTSL
jgi:hypothetical protein